MKNSKVRLFFWVVFLALGCSKDEKQVTTNCILLKEGDNYVLSVKYHEGRIEKYENVRKIGSIEKSVLILFERNDQPYWMYFYDGEVVVKSWGPYGQTEFATRARELGIENYRIDDVDRF